MFKVTNGTVAAVKYGEEEGSHKPGSGSGSKGFEDPNERFMFGSDRATGTDNSFCVSNNIKS